MSLLAMLRASGLWKLTFDNLSFASEHEADASRLDLPLTRKLAAGWYMLEVVHGTRTIGASFSLRCGHTAHAHVQLRGRPLVKRIVLVKEALAELSLGVDMPAASIKRVTLSRVSAGFAHRRMRSRLQARGADTPAPPELQAAYDTFHHRHLHSHHLHAGHKPADVCSAALQAGDQPYAGPLHILFLCEDSAAAGKLEPAVCAWHEQGITAEVTTSRRGLTEAVSSDRLELVAFLDAGIRLDLHHLLQMLLCLQRESQLCYADHEHHEGVGGQSTACLKPAWNPDMLLDIDYIGGFILCQRGWLREALESGALPELTRGVVLALAATTLTARQVQHVALCVTSSERNQVDGNWCACTRDALGKRHESIRVVPGLLSHTARVIWPLPEPQPSVDIIIPTRDRVELLSCCVESILSKTDYDNLRITVIDNDSVEPATHRCLDRLGADARVNVMQVGGAFNYSALNNRAVSRSTADIVVLLNNDTEVIHAGWLSELVRQAIRPGIGCVGAKLYYSNGRIQHAGVVVGIAGVAAHGHRYHHRDASGYADRLQVVQNVTAVTGACLAVRRSIYSALRGLDESNLPVSYNDVDFCLRVREAGYRNVWTPHAELYHHESVSRAGNQSRQAKRLALSETRYMMQRWALEQFDDPAYHPQLTRVHEDFGL